MEQTRGSCRGAFLVRGLGAALVAGALAGCAHEGNSPTQPHEIYTVQMVNDDVVAVHLLAPGEDFPTGRVEPGSARSVSVEFPGLAVTFRAGRNGAILASLICGPVATNEEPGIVVWSEAGTLSCAGSIGPF